MCVSPPALRSILRGSSGHRFLVFAPFPVAWGMLLGPRRAAGKGSTRESVFPLSQAAEAVLELSGVTSLSWAFAKVPRLLLAEGGERAPTASCTPACTPASPVLPGLPSGAGHSRPGASQGCKA